MARQPIPAVNIWVARVIPLILIGFIVYSAFVITKVLAIDYLINPPPALSIPRRPGSAIAILIVYYILLIPLLVCYVRLLHKIATDPGHVPRSLAWHQQRREEDAQKKHTGRGYHSRRRRQSQSLEKSQEEPPTVVPDLESGRSDHTNSASSKAPAAHQFPWAGDHAADIPFWQRDIFVCTADGRPPFCSRCLTYKTDRTHHCSEIDRCVLKMDHFCPWVGGIISETSFKFFIQFTVYAVLFCMAVLTSVAIFIAERRRNEGPAFLDIHYFLILGVSALFLVFSIGMAGSSIQLALINSSTVENLNRRSKVWFLAVLIPRNPDGTLSSTQKPQGVHGPRYNVITYPRPPEEAQLMLDQAKSAEQKSGASSSTTTTTTTAVVPTTQNPTSPQVPQTTDLSPAQPTRTFAILATKGGENPFDIGPRSNFCEVMGYSVSEWILPIKASPCADHSSRINMFPLNQALLARLKQEAGLGSSGPALGSASAPKNGLSHDSDSLGNGKKKRRRRRTQSTGTVSGNGN